MRCARQRAPSEVTRADLSSCAAARGGLRSQSPKPPRDNKQPAVVVFEGISMSRTDSQRPLDRPALQPQRVTLQMLPNDRAERHIATGDLWHGIFDQSLGRRQPSRAKCADSQSYDALGKATAFPFVFAILGCFAGESTWSPAPQSCIVQLGYPQQSTASASSVGCGGSTLLEGQHRPCSAFEPRLWTL
jgi:hypothetical protein